MLIPPQWHYRLDSVDLPEVRNRFKQHVELMFSGPFKAKSEEEQCSYLLIQVGDEGQDFFTTWWTELTEAEKKLITYYDHFKSYVESKSNTVLARYNLYHRMKSETFEVSHRTKAASKEVVSEILMKGSEARSCSVTSLQRCRKTLSKRLGFHTGQGHRHSKNRRVISSPAEIKGTTLRC